MTGPESTTKRTRRRSFVSSGLTYEQVARELGVPLCDGSQECDCPQAVNETYDEWTRRHMRGFATLRPWDRRRIHWSERRMSHRGLYAFLKIVTFLLYTDEAVTPEFGWLRLYRQNILARELAARFGVRFPRTFTERDRARVRLSLSMWNPRPGTDDEFPEQRNLIRRVKTWSRP